MEKDKIIDREAVHTICDSKGKLEAILRIDPVSRKHLIYFVVEGTCEDIAEKLIRTNFGIKAPK